MNKEESDLIIAEQNKSIEKILKAVAKFKSDYHELCKLKDMRIEQLEKENAQLKEEKVIIKKIEKIFYSGENALKRLSKISDILAEAEQFINSEVEK